MAKKFLFVLVFLISVSLHGQDVIFQTDYPRVVTVGEQFSITWTVNAGGGELSAPSFTGFYKLMGPQTTYSSSIQTISGKISQQTSYSYVYYLQAMNEGKYILAPATLKIKNKTYQSDSIHIEVVKEAKSSQPVQENNVSNNPVEGQGSGSELFLKLILNRNEVYIGESVVATIKIYTRVDLSGLNEIKFPEFNGFIKENIETPPLTSLRRENINGTIYGTGIVQQSLLIPQVTGDITINPVEITALIQQKTRQADPFFGDFFGSYQQVPRVIASQPVKILVKPLPGLKPDDFSGVVGKLEMNASVNKDTVNINDAINFKVIISGSGNLKFSGSPKLKLSPDIDVYDPKINDNIKIDANGSSGQKTFEYLLIPRHYGEYSIPPISYSYFNTSLGRYEKLTTREFNFYARKGAEQSATGTTVYGGVSKEEIKYLGKDIRFIKNLPGNLKRHDNILISKRSFISLYGFGVFVFLLVLFIRREHIRRNSDLSIVRNRKAAKVAGKRLQEASKCMKEKLHDRFYEEILKALWGYLSDKLSIPVSDLTRTNAIISLKEKGISDEHINNLTSILDICEFARFSPSSSETDITDIYNGTMQFIRTVENFKGQ